MGEAKQALEHKNMISYLVGASQLKGPIQFATKNDFAYFVKALAGNISDTEVVEIMQGQKKGTRSGLNSALGGMSENSDIDYSAISVANLRIDCHVLDQHFDKWYLEE